MTEYGLYALCYATRDARRGEHFCGFDERSGESHPTAYYVWAAISDQHVIVIDAGMHPDRRDRPAGLDYHASPVELLGELGVEPGDVHTVVLTHLHYDHTGTAHEFPRARYVVQRSEFDYWTGHWARRIERERRLHDTGDLERLRGSGRLDLVDGDVEPVPGLSVHAVGGHTAGMQVVRVATRRGDAVVASDASHFYENIERDRPFPILHSMPAMYGAFDRIHALVGAPELVVAGHDPEVLRRFPPASPDLAGRVARIA